MTLVGLYGFVNIGGKSGQGSLMKIMKIRRQEVVVIHIDYNPCIVPVLFIEPAFAFPYLFMLIGEMINIPVEQNPLLYGFGILGVIISFYKIRNEVSHHYIRVVKREIGMG
jgi:hypothetical protein